MRQLESEAIYKWKLESEAIYKWKCDFCEKELINPLNWKVFIIQAQNAYNFHNVDMCSECFNKLPQETQDKFEPKQKPAEVS